jgi:hypothetical protein
MKRPFSVWAGTCMLEDKILVHKFNRASKNALHRIYEKYKNDLLGLAVTLLTERSAAEDVVHPKGSSSLKGPLMFHCSTLSGQRPVAPAPQFLSPPPNPFRIHKVVT